MAGQGRPRQSRGRYLRGVGQQRHAARSLPKRSRLRRWLVCGWAVLALLVGHSSRAGGEEFRLRIAWGGGVARQWQGTISLTEGSVSDPRLLGLEADEPGSMWIDRNARPGGAVVVRQRSPRGYDGLDLLVSAPATARLLLQLSASDDDARPAAMSVPLADVAGEFLTRELDGRGNRLLVMRTPGDLLRVRMERDSLVFAAGETMKFLVEPHGLPPADGAKPQIKIQLLNSGGKELWSRQAEVAGDGAAPMPVEIPLPAEEGVYDVAISELSNASWSQAVRQPLSWKRIIALRRVQIVVLQTGRPPAGPAEAAWKEVAEIDPSSPRWYEKLGRLSEARLAKAHLPRLWKSPLGNDCLRPRRHVLGELAELRPDADAPDVSWQAFWLPISQPGRPHLLEVDYPSDVAQTLGIAIVEPNTAGVMTPMTIGSGIDNSAEPVGGDPRWRQHRLIFWPRTASPLVLLTNARQGAPALCGKLRVFSGAERLPAAPRGPAGNRRLLAAYLDRPLLAQVFSAAEGVDPWSGRCLDDWRTFYEAGTRLVDYLNHVGYNGLMIGVAADGSAIYPSAALEPTPRYDSGVFFSTGQDPLRKDALEMLLRLFDREGLRLIPMVEFASPLPELEAVCRAGGRRVGRTGMDRRGRHARGASWPPRRGLAPYYNLLHPRVQEAMLRVLRELASRYAGHPSLAGLAVRLSADGYAQLPGPEWGLDDDTMARFAAATNLRLPAEGPQRFAERAATLAREPQRRAWLAWRAEQLGRFYRRACQELTSVLPDARLYLAGADMFGAERDAELRPSLPRRATLAEAMLQVGIDAQRLRDVSQRLVLLRPERIVSRCDLGACAAELEVEQMTDADRYFQTLAVPGSLFYHPPREAHVASFDEQNPFKPSYLWLVSQTVPAANRNRRRFVHSLAALDSQVIVNGGWTLPMGEEDSVRNLIATGCALPAISFHTVAGSGGLALPSVRDQASLPVPGSEQADPRGPSANENPPPGGEASQPVTFRWATYDGRQYLYAVNDAPFSTTARIHIDASPACQLEELSGGRTIAPLRAEGNGGFSWEIELEPYDLAAVRLSEAGATFSNPQATWSGAVEAGLAAQIGRLGARAAALRNPPPLDVVANSGFEGPAARPGEIPDWTITGGGGGSVQLDRTQKHDGQQSVKMESRPGGLDAEPAVRHARHRPAGDLGMAAGGRRLAATALAAGAGG